MVDSLLIDIFLQMAFSMGGDLAYDGAKKLINHFRHDSAFAEKYQSLTTNQEKVDFLAKELKGMRITVKDGSFQINQGTLNAVGAFLATYGNGFLFINNTTIQADRSIKIDGSTNGQAIIQNKSHVGVRNGSSMNLGDGASCVLNGGASIKFF